MYISYTASYHLTHELLKTEPMEMKIAVFCNVMLHSLLETYWHFRWSCCIQLHSGQ